MRYPAIRQGVRGATTLGLGGRAPGRDRKYRGKKKGNGKKVKKKQKNKQNPEYRLGDIVYLYKPSVQGNVKKLKRPWVGPFYIAEKLSNIHVKLRRKCDGKLIKNRIHVDRLKHGHMWSDEPLDPQPLNDQNVEQSA